MDRSPVSTAGVPGLGLAVVLGGQVPVKIVVRVQGVSLAGGGRHLLTLDPTFLLGPLS